MFWLAVPSIVVLVVSGGDIAARLERLYRSRYEVFCRMAMAVTGDIERANPDSIVKFATIPPTANVVLVDRVNCCERTIEVTVAELAAMVNKGGAKTFWVTAFANGVVSRIEEQYVP